MAPTSSPEDVIERAIRLDHEDGIAWITLDHPEKKVNTLSSAVMARFESFIDELEANPPKGLVILSGKKDTFIAGADIEEIQALADPPQVRELLANGHALLTRVSKLPFPVVSAIHGACLGGGLELSLACHLRIASTSEKTKLGLPEVMIGIFPGLGGTQRLPRLIGPVEALPLILTGKNVNARKAKRLGLVDETCHPADLKKAAKGLIEKGKDRGRHRPKKPLPTKIFNTLAGLPLAKNLVYGRAKGDVLKKTGGHYPAPLIAVDVVRRGLATNLQRGLEIEAEAFADLVVKPEAKRLMGIFFMKTDADGRAAALAKSSDRDLDSIGVLGAGFMGSGVAQVLAYKNTRVVIKDRDHEGVGRGLAHCRSLFDKLVKRRKMKPMARDLAMSRLEGTTSYEGFGALDFVIEAVFESVELKHRVIQETEAAGPDNLIFASNTSTIPIARLAEASRRPENVVGMHFFSPVHKMPLLEIIRHPTTSDETVAATVKVGKRMGKTMIVVNDGPGFFTTRVLAPFLNEAAWLLTGGAKIEDIDKALSGWGFPVGPISLMDEVGIDIGAHVSEVLLEYFGERITPPPVFQRLIDDGRKGRKAGKGFFRYEGGKKQGVDEGVYPLLGWSHKPVSREEIIERCWFQMLNETAHCIQDGIIENPIDIDLGVIFGFGFPPFRGGLLREADRVGLGTIVDKLDAYADAHGERLRPAELLRTMAKEGKRFHQG
ncbi:MAG: 3-hydroxyacyl-CoA dehydrogenase NAD-binding domain-containing protein [Acidobacteriota bacterium]